MRNSIIHLDEDQFIRSLVDESDLAVSARSHLSVCPACQEEKQRFSRTLNRLGHKAKDFAPLPQRKIVLLPEPSFFEKFGIFPLKRFAFSGGFVFVLLMMIGLWWTSSPFTTQEEDRQFAKIIEETDAEQQPLDEIQVLEGYTLPEFYMDVSGESSGYFGDEFLDFVVPLEEKSGTTVGSVGFICSSALHNQTREPV